MSKLATKTPLFLAIWVAICAVLNCAGWILSGLHQLSAVGYVVVLLLFAALALVWWWSGRAAGFQFPSLHREKRRLKRFLPLAFLLLAFLALLGGALHPPSNYDALAYREPRVLHWLAAGRWHWIHAIFNRINTRAVGFEWLTAPQFALLRTDRVSFVINIVSLLFLPGLFFSTLMRLGVRSRVAWHWMWILPTGYNYLLQAGSIGNDLFGATFVLAAFNLALRARATKSYADIWLSLLAAALFSGSKLSNLPLLLPWAIAFLPSCRLLFARLAASAGVVAVGAVCSFLPMAIVNYEYSRDWTGFKGEQSPFNRSDYGLHLTHNSILIVMQNLVPPVFPLTKTWDREMAKLIPPARREMLEQNFEPSQAHMQLPEMQTEESAGLGFGVSLLLLLSWLAAWRFAQRENQTAAAPLDLVRWAMLLTPFISLAVFMAKSGLATEARLASPYYALVVPILLMGGGQSRIVRTRWWRAGAAMVFVLGAVLLVISPGRPLWPARTILAHIGQSNPTVARMKEVYTVYGDRANSFAPALRALPPNIKVLGAMTADDPEAALWRPFGSRRIELVTPEDTLEDLQRRDIEYILVSPTAVYLTLRDSWKDWLAQHQAEVVQTIPLDLRASIGPMDWMLVRVKR